MSQHFNICMSYELMLSPKEEVKLIEEIIGLFKTYFTTITKMVVVELPWKILASLSDRNRLIDLLTEMRTTTEKMLFIYGVSETGFTNCISINYTNYSIQIVISLPFQEITKINKESLQSLWIQIWNSMTTFKILLLAVGDELEFDDCSLPNQLRFFLDRLSLACWVIVPKKLITDLGNSLESNNYEAISQNVSYEIFVSKNIEPRLIP